MHSSTRDEGDGTQPIAITTQEEKELQRVYTLLCDYQKKVDFLEDIRTIEGNAYMQKLLTKGALSDSRATHDEAKLENDQNEALAKIKIIQEQIVELDSRPDNHPGNFKLRKLILYLISY